MDTQGNIIGPDPDMVPMEDLMMDMDEEDMQGMSSGRGDGIPEGHPDYNMEETEQLHDMQINPGQGMVNVASNGNP